MKYQNANLILPKALVEELQKYLQGGYLYVPSKKDERKAWGELSGCKKEINARNQKILQEYQNGNSVEKLADSYFLSIHAIKKIIYSK